MTTKIIAILLILVSVIILLILPSIIFPSLAEGPLDTGEYCLRIGINALRFMMISGILSVLGIKILSKEQS